MSVDPIAFSPQHAATLFAPLRQVYVFYGEDDLQKDDALELLRRAAVTEEFADFDLEYIDADTHGAVEILAAAGLAPFGSERRLVIVRSAELFRRRERTADADRLAEGLCRLGASTCLALRVGAGPEEDRRAKTVLTAKLDRAAAQSGLMVLCKGLSDDALGAWLQSEAGRAGKVLETPAAARLARSSRGDRQALANELEKAICYVGSRDHIALSDVEQVVTYDPEDVMFRLVDAVFARNADRALTLLRELLRYDARPQGAAGRLLSLLSRQVRLVWQARELAAAGIGAQRLRDLPAEIADELPGDGSITAVAWKARDIYSASRSWSRPRLLDALRLLVRCDLANKGGETDAEDPVLNLELLIVRLCAQNP